MNKILTISEIKAQYDSQWILIENPETNESLEVQKGKVRYHSKDRDEVYQMAIQLRPKNFAMLYTGEIPEGTAIVL